MAEENRPVLTALTGLRAVAAIGVVISHSGVPADLPEALDKIAHYGHIGVPLFFMLSGVVLAYNYAHLSGWQGKRTIRFYLARIARVIPLYWAVIAYCAVYLWIQGRDNHNWALIQNLLAVQTWSGDLRVAMGWYNSPGWSIGVEMFFYLLFPFLIPVVAKLYRRFGARGMIALIGAMFLIMFVLWISFYLAGHTSMRADNPVSAHRWLYRNPLCHLPMFISGMAASFLIPYGARWSTGRQHLIQAFVFCFVFGMGAFRPDGSGWSSAAYGLLWVVPFSLLMISLASGRGWAARFLSTTVMVRLGVASYALYITHRWMLYALPHTGYIKKGQDWVPYGALLVTIVILLLIAEGAHQYVEEPCRRWILKVTRRWTADAPSRPVPDAPDQRTAEPARTPDHLADTVRLVITAPATHR